MTFLFLLLIPILVALISFIFGKGRISLKEFFVQLFVQVVIAGISVLIIYGANTIDVEIWNGKVTDKKREEVHCRHSYSCNCVTICSGSGSSRTCNTICQTCYYHDYDVDWNVYTDIGTTFNINKLDNQGIKEPPRWTRAYVGEPVAVSHYFENYIKASPDSLFRYQGIKEKYKKLPNYPVSIYDYHYIDRFVQVGNKFEKEYWNSDLMNLNADLGKLKKCNIIILITKEVNEEYFYAVQQHWLGGKKNDIVLIISVKEDLTFNWVDVMAWSKSDIFQIKLRDDILSLGILDREKIINSLRENITKNYEKKSFEEFAYLKSRITPTFGQWITSIIFGLISSVVISALFYKEDVL